MVHLDDAAVRDGVVVRARRFVGGAAVAPALGARPVPARARSRLSAARAPFCLIFASVGRRATSSCGTWQSQVQRASVPLGGGTPTRRTPPTARAPRLSPAARPRAARRPGPRASLADGTRTRSLPGPARRRSVFGRASAAPAHFLRRWNARAVFLRLHRPLVVPSDYPPAASLRFASELSTWHPAAVPRFAPTDG